MKKAQLMRLSVALAGSAALILPGPASAVAVTGVTCTAATNINETSSCSGSGGFTDEAIDFTSSKGVSVDVSDTASDFSACAYHLSGSKSFGMSTGSTVMVTRNATGKTASSGVGCIE